MPRLEILMNRILKKCLLVALYVVLMTDIFKVHTGIALLAKSYLDQQQQIFEELQTGVQVNGDRTPGLSQPPRPPVELEGADDITLPPIELKEEDYEIALPPSNGLALVMIPYLEGKREIPPDLKPMLDRLEAGFDIKADELRPLSFDERRRELDSMHSFDHGRDQGYEEFKWLRAHFIREMNERGVCFQLETTR